LRACGVTQEELWAEYRKQLAIQQERGCETAVNQEVADPDNIAWVVAENARLEQGCVHMQHYRDIINGAVLLNDERERSIGLKMQSPQQQAGNRQQQVEAGDPNLVADTIMDARTRGIRIYFETDHRGRRPDFRHAKGTSFGYEDDILKEGCKFSAKDVASICRFSRMSTKNWKKIQTDLKQAFLAACMRRVKVRNARR
jgi:hypothetical protein